jgi:hypothetical protein
MAITSASAERRSGELTQERLLRFGAAIVALILFSFGIAMWSLRSAADSTTATRVGSEAITALDDMVVDTLTVNRSRFGRSISLYSESEELVSRFTTEGLAAFEKFQADLGVAVELSHDAGIDGSLVEELEVTAETWMGKVAGFWTEDALVLQPDTYEKSLGALQALRAAQNTLRDGLRAHDVAIGKDAESGSTRGQLLAAVGSLSALIGFGLIGRRVYRSVGEMRAMQREMARVNAMIESSPTGMLFADETQSIRYLNPSGANTLRPVRLGAEHLGERAARCVGLASAACGAERHRHGLPARR